MHFDYSECFPFARFLTKEGQESERERERERERKKERENDAEGEI